MTEALSPVKGPPRRRRRKGGGTGHYVASEYRSHTLVVVDGAYLRIGGEGYEHHLTPRWLENVIAEECPEAARGPRFWFDGDRSGLFIQRNGFLDAGWQVTLDSDLGEGGQSRLVDARVQAALMGFPRPLRSGGKERTARGNFKVTLVLIAGDGDHAKALWRAITECVELCGVRPELLLVAWEVRASSAGQRGGCSSELRRVPDKLFGKMTMKTILLNLADLRKQPSGAAVASPGVVLLPVPQEPCPFRFLLEIREEYLVCGGAKNDSVARLLRHPGLPDVVQSLWHRCPAWCAETVEQPRVVIINGETGCGKTTQIPQLLYDMYGFRSSTRASAGATDWRRPRIAVIQPRRVACQSVAKRVCIERDARTRLPWDKHLGRCEEGQGLGNGVTGYHIMGERCGPETASILFMTTGVLLLQLLHQPDVAYDWIVLDEFHERTTNYDLLLTLSLRHSSARILVMSATLGEATQRIEKYCRSRISLTAAGCVKYHDITYKVPDDPSTTSDPIPIRGEWKRVAWATPAAPPPRCEVLYLDHLLDGDHGYGSALGEKSRVHFDKLKAEMRKDYDFEKVREAPRGARRITEERLCFAKALLSAVVEESSERGKTAVVVVFVPGWSMMCDFERYYERSMVRDFGAMGQDIAFHKLHSTLPQDEQLRAVDQHDEGVHKIVAATSIAESSLTIPGVTHIIDMCLQRVPDMDGRIRVLGVEYIAQDSGDQRKGRAGRTNQGHCIRLLSRYEFSRLDKTRRPEICREDLERTVISVMGKVSGLRRV
eukprot:Hpha_TRINITY_DN5241_c0_g1::TRINITY_DN5241_c0_g1_i1::g.116541::m.116541